MYEDAYRVPFRLERIPPEYRLLNDSAEPLHGVALTLHGPGQLAFNEPARLLPGEALEVTVDAQRLGATTIGVVRWFRPNGIEYLWRLVF